MQVRFSGQRLHTQRKQQKITQADMAERAGTSSRYLGALERGEKKNPSAVLLCQFSMALDVPMEELMETHGEREELS